MSYLEVHNVTKTLGEKKILNGINLTVEKGEVMCLVGPSGSGKTTFLRCLNRLIGIDAGNIFLDGQDITIFSPTHLRRHMVLVSQDTIMFPGTVYDNVSYGPSLMGSVNEKHIKKCLRGVGLPLDFLNRDASKLSGGEKRRVSLAMALALKPPVLLLDEPTVGIDPKNIETVERNILLFAQNMNLTVLWVTHYIEQAMRVSNRIANVKRGIIKSVKKTQGFEWRGAY